MSGSNVKADPVLALRASQLAPADVTDLLREGRMLENVRRFVIGNEPAVGATEHFDACCAAALLGRLLELVEDGAV